MRPNAVTKDTRSCGDCKKIKHVDEFYKASKGSQGKGSRCKVCQKEYYLRTSTVTSRKDGKLRTRYGITLKEYDALFKSQRYKCRICKTKEGKMDLDHCHKSNKVRGILCQHCNRGLGSFKDNIMTLIRSIIYLIRSK